MRLVTASTVACALAIASGGCLRTTAFHCSSNMDCGATGTCELVGFCSFVDPSCASGRRFGDLSLGFSNVCVGDPSLVDAATQDTSPGDGPRDAPSTVAFCDAAGEPTLVGCWEFENNLLDHSGDNNNGIGTMVTYAAGKVGLAASVAPAGHISVPDSTSLTPTAVTIEAWIHPTTLPTGGARMGVFDNDGQYGAFLITGGVQCSFGSVLLPFTTALPTNAWTHFACTFDGTTGHLYLDGQDMANVGGGTALGAGSTSGGAIAGNSPTGDTLDGLIDQLRIWNVARTAQQICQAAGGSGC